MTTANAGDGVGPPVGRSRRRHVRIEGLRHQAWRARVSDLLEVTAVASLVFVLAIYLRDGGGQDLLFGTWPNA